MLTLDSIQTALPSSDGIFDEYHVANIVDEYGRHLAVSFEIETDDHGPRIVISEVIDTSNSDGADYFLNSRREREVLSLIERKMDLFS